MKTRRVVNFILAIVMFIVMGCTWVIPIFAASQNLDEILNYGIKIDVRQDGTMDIRYSIDWKVLSDKNGKEPVSWVDIGIPNKNVDQIQILTDNIKSAEYSSKNGGSYVRIDFKEKYYEDDIISFEFSIHQSYMYWLDSKDTVRYSFTPGWFEDIEIDNLQIEWTIKDGFTIKETDSNEQSSMYYIWSYKNLAEGEKVTANVKYDSDGFFVDEKMQCKEDGDGIGGWIIIGLIVLIVIVIVIFAIIDDDDDYDGGRGYGGGNVFIHSSCAHSSCVHSSCACACACACAGGGRAGCSVKDFYSNEDIFMSVKDFNTAIDKINKDK